MFVFIVIITEDICAATGLLPRHFSGKNAILDGIRTIRNSIHLDNIYRLIPDIITLSSIVPGNTFENIFEFVVKFT